MPQNWFEGLVVVMGLDIAKSQIGMQDPYDAKMTYAKLMEPVNLEESVPPKVSSPLTVPGTDVGSNEMATRSCSVTACANKLSTTTYTN